MLGNALGLFVGGILGAKVAPVAPFLAATILLVASTILSSCFLPYIPPTSVTSKSGSLLVPIKVFRPRTGWYGLVLLAVGTFTATFATSFVRLLPPFSPWASADLYFSYPQLPLLLQLHGTQSYAFEADTVRSPFLRPRCELTLPIPLA
jgi:hypothetical protein